MPTSPKLRVVDLRSCLCTRADRPVSALHWLHHHPVGTSRIVTNDFRPTEVEIVEVFQNAALDTNADSCANVLRSGHLELLLEAEAAGVVDQAHPPWLDPVEPMWRPAPHQCGRERKPLQVQAPSLVLFGHPPCGPSEL